MWSRVCGGVQVLAELSVVWVWVWVHVLLPPLRLRRLSISISLFRLQTNMGMRACSINCSSSCNDARMTRSGSVLVSGVCLAVSASPGVFVSKWCVFWCGVSVLPSGVRWALRQSRCHTASLLCYIVAHVGCWLAPVR